MYERLMVHENEMTTADQQNVCVCVPHNIHCNLWRIHPFFSQQRSEKRKKNEIFGHFKSNKEMRMKEEAKENCVYIEREASTGVIAQILLHKKRCR